MTYNPAVGGKVFSDGRSIFVRRVPCWDADKMDLPDTVPEGWRSMSDVERAIWVLENSGKPVVQVYSHRAEWKAAPAPA
jgi:hypothetical protein